MAKEVALKDKFENMGAQIVKQVASKTSDIAGDGTTTAIVLAEAIFQAGVKNVTAGANPMSLKRGIDKAVDALIQGLNDLATPVSSSMKSSKLPQFLQITIRKSARLLAKPWKKLAKMASSLLQKQKALKHM